MASSRHDKSPEFPEDGFQKRSLEGRRGFDIFPRRVGSGDMVSTSPPSFGVDRARTPPKFKSNGTRDIG